MRKQYLQDLLSLNTLAVSQPTMLITWEGLKTAITDIVDKYAKDNNTRIRLTLDYGTGIYAYDTNPSAVSSVSDNNVTASNPNTPIPIPLKTLDELGIKLPPKQKA